MSFLFLKVAVRRGNLDGLYSTIGKGLYNVFYVSGDLIHPILQLLVIKEKTYSYSFSLCG